MVLGKQGAHELKMASLLVSLGIAGADGLMRRALFLGMLIWKHENENESILSPSLRDSLIAILGAVSYTHLTLPTKRIV